MRHERSWLAYAGLLVAALHGARPLAADDHGQPRPEEPRPEAGLEEPSPEERASRQALEAGLAYLAARQAQLANGSFPRGDAQEWAPIGVSALATLAFMAAGSSPGRGPYGDEVARGVDYLLQHADLSPESEAPGFISVSGDEVSKTHGHGFATLALAEAYGMTRNATRIGRALEAAVRLIESSQGAEGGWYYEPRATASHEGSVTICHVQALRAARNSGLRVSGEVIAKAEDYVHRLQSPDGTFRYMLDSNDTSVALTAAGVATLNMAGHYDDGSIQSGIDAIWKELTLRSGERRDPKFPCYERLYLAQAFWQLSDPTNFERWFETERKELLRTQQKDGSWSNRRFGSTYATAVNCLVLAIPDGVLPIFQR